MQWLIKRGFESDPKYRELCDDLMRMGIKHTYCNVIPFSEDGLTIESELSEEPLFSYGSYTLSKIVKSRGYRPGSFISKDIDFDSLKNIYGSELLNYDMSICRLEDAIPTSELFFIRPMEDNKAFTAKVMDIAEFKRFKEGIVNLGDGFSTVTKDTPVLISTPKEIMSEIRFFIVDGKIATQSLYKLGDSVWYSAIVDQYIIDYVKDVVSSHRQPDVAYVLDVAVIERNIPKVLEINSINSSGLYAIDTQKLIAAVEDLTDRYS